MQLKPPEGTRDTELRVREQSSINHFCVSCQYDIPRTCERRSISEGQNSLQLLSDAQGSLADCESQDHSWALWGGHFLPVFEPYCGCHLHHHVLRVESK